MDETTDHVDGILAQWAAVRPDLDTSPVAVIGRLGRVLAHVDQALEGMFGRYGLTRAGWDLLAALRRLGPPYRLSQTELTAALMRTPGTVSVRLARLEADGLITRHPDPADSRAALVELTPAGLALVDQAVDAHLANERSLLAALTPAEQATLAALLRKLLVSYGR